MRRVCFCDDQQAAGILVEPVNDARPLYPADARQTLAAVGKECVNKCAIGVPGSGMHHDPSGFIQNQDIFVLEDNVEREVLRDDVCCDGWRYLQLIAPARFDLVSWRAYRLTILVHMAGFDQYLQPRAAKVLNFGLQEAVQPHSIVGLAGEQSTHGIWNWSGAWFLKWHDVMADEIRDAAGYTPGQIRTLKIAIAIMTAAILGGMAVLVASIAYRATRGKQDPAIAGAAPAGAAATMAVGTAAQALIPAGSRVTAMTPMGDKILLAIEDEHGTSLSVFDPKTLQLSPMARLNQSN